nr:hypothetical protein [Mesorhizobium kowhaii]
MPVSDNAVNAEAPVYRNLWDHIGKVMPKKGAGKSGELDPLSIPAQLQTALISLFSHYKTEYDEWQRVPIPVPPVFIVVCNNTASSKLVYEWVSGWQRGGERQMQTIHHGHLELFSNYEGLRFPRNGYGRDRAVPPREAGREGAAAENISDSELLREVMNTVGQKGRVAFGLRVLQTDPTEADTSASGFAAHYNVNAGVATGRSKALSHYNAHISTKPVSGWHLQPGHIFKAGQEMWVRARIAEPERDLIAPTPQGRHRRFEAGHELRNAKLPGAS